jgi:hypothetical protein
MISTRNLAALPGIEALKKLTQAMAMLDACLSPEWEYRWYSFDAAWDSSEQLASMRNGSGDAWFCVFGARGAILKGFDHESPMSPWQTGQVWRNVLHQVPPSLGALIADAAFSREDTTFCIWRAREDRAWQVGAVSFPAGDDPDGSGWMLSMLDSNPLTFQDWAKDYYERPIDFAAVEHIYAHQPLTAEIVRTLNPTIDLSVLAQDVAEIGYPTA